MLGLLLPLLMNLGFAGGEEAIPDVLSVAVGEVYADGGVSGEVYANGAVAGDSYTNGAAEGETTP
jgi:hypothetical protein